MAKKRKVKRAKLTIRQTVGLRGAGQLKARGLSDREIKKTMKQLVTKGYRKNLRTAYKGG